jgi:AraC-like DNA-binding protein/mannose-6-phosphate isomerase-like protein (cupin superfamily)
MRRGSREKVQVPGGHSFRVLRWSRSVQEVECVISPEVALPLDGEGGHWHFHEAMELTLFTSGEGTRFVGDNIARFAAGDLVLLGPDLPHYWHAEGLSGGCSVQWHFPEGHPVWAFPETVNIARLFRRARCGLHFGRNAASKAAALLQELPRCTGAQRLGLLLHILGGLAAAESSSRGLSVRSFELSGEPQYQQAIARAMQHLIARFRDRVRLEEVLEITEMSRATFARQFPRHSGRSFSEFLNSLRLQAVCQELKNSSRSISEIALDAGFTQLSFFNRLFLRENQCSPSEYRKKLH